MKHRLPPEEVISYYLRLAAGLAATGALLFLSFLSVRQNFTLQSEVIGGLIALIIVLIYGVDPLIDLLEAWKNGGN